MAKRSKSAPAGLVVSRTSQSWRSMTCWGFSLAIVLLLLVILYGDQSEDMYIDHSIWSEVYMPDKYGVGVVAKKNISRGTLILREKPILLWDDAQGEMPSAQWVTENVAKLPFRKRQAFKALSSHGAPGAGKDEAKWKTNAFWAGGKGGIFLKTSRFNHGCAGAKNIAIHWREETKTFDSYAIKDVPMGEELLTEYFDTGKTTRPERQAILLKGFNFVCKCSVCTLPRKESQQSDLRLATISELNGHIGKTKNGLEETQLVNRILKLTDEEDVPSSRGQLAWIATKAAAIHADEDATKEWAMLAEKWARIELGNDHKTTQMVSRGARNPRGIAGWAAGPQMTVERPILKP